MKITIYAEQAPEVRAKLDRLAKKAAKYGAALSYSIGPEHPEPVRVWAAGEFNGQTVRRLDQTFTVAACDVEIDGEELIRQAGWTVLAHIAHEAGGNIVTTISGEPDPAWWSIGPHCDHCGTRRARSATYIVQQEDGTTRQVGKTCLRDYTGIDPAAAALWASVRDIDTVTDMDAAEWTIRKGGRMYPVEMVLGLACDSIRARGYRKSDTELSTRTTVLLALARGEEPTAAAAEKAAQIVAWLDGLSPDTAGPLERDCKALASSGWVHPRHVGQLAYMSVAFDKRRPETPAAAGAWVGEPGQRIAFTAAAAELVTSWEGEFGTVRLYKFQDDAGNVYTWRASKAVTLAERMTIKGTVKDHAEYKGERQTVLTRCAIN